MRSKIRTHRDFLLVCLLFFLLPLVAFWRKFDLSGVNTNYFGHEFIGGYYPEFLLGMEMFGKFKDMLWDPYNHLGIPHIGAVDRLGIFYPVKFTFYAIGSVLPPNYRLFLISYFSIFHISLAGIFMYIFSRRVLKLTFFSSLVVGTIFMLNGTNIRFSAFPNHILSIAYLPLVLYFLHSAVAEKNILKCLLAGIFISPALLSGYTPFFLYNNVFAFAFLLLIFQGSGKEILTVVLYLTVANVFAFGLSAPALLPNLENATMSERAAYNLVGSSANPYNPLMFVHYIFPGFFPVSYGTPGIILGYVGITTLMLTLLAFAGTRNKYLFAPAILAFLFFFLSLGNFTFLHQIAYLLVPKYKYFRFPGSMHYIVAFCAACVAGYGLETLGKKRNLLNLVKTPFTIVSGVFISLLMVAYILKNSIYGTENYVDITISAMLINALFFFLSLVTLYAVNLYPQMNKYKVVLFIIICLQLFNVASLPGPANSDLDPRVINGNNELITWLRDNTKDDYSRVYLVDSNIRYNSASSKLYQLSGYFSMSPKNLSLLFSPYANNNTGNYDLDCKALDVAGVKYIVSKEDVNTQTYPDLKKVVGLSVEKKNYGQFMDWRGNMLPIGTPVYVYENVNFMPKLLFFTKMERAFSDEQAAQLFQNVNERDTVVLTLKPSDKVGSLATGPNIKSDNKIFLTKYSNTEITALTNNKVPGILVLNDLYYPSWKVEVDGNASQIFKADVAFRGVYLPAGSHTVHFYYYPQYLYFGIYISAASLILLAIASFLQLGKTKTLVVRFKEDADD